MLACTLPAVTPPLVNTGLEVSSVDKNILASQQRGRKARIPLSPASIVHEKLKTSTIITKDFLALFPLCEKFKYAKADTVSQSTHQMFALCSIC